MSDKWTFSPQKGVPGHCFVAQVWRNGIACLEVEPTDDPDEASGIAERVCEAMNGLGDIKAKAVAFAKDLAANFDHEGRDECYRCCRVCAAERFLKSIGE